PDEEALRRIREAKETDAEILDLGDLALETLPPELGGLTRLRVLALGKQRPVPDEASGVKWKWDHERAASPVSVLTPLSGLASLEELDLSDCPNLGSFDPLEGLLPHLTGLYLYGAILKAWPNDINGRFNENVLDAVSAYVIDSRDDPQDEREVKVLVL